MQRTTLALGEITLLTRKLTVVGWILFALLIVFAVTAVYYRDRLDVLIPLQSVLVLLCLLFFGTGFWARRKHIENQRRLLKRLKRLRDKYKRRSLIDPLMQIYNKRAFRLFSEVQFEQSRRYGNPLAVIFIDLDHFKTINDRYSHKAGDDVLVAVAGLIKSILRKGDIFARYGGEELVVLLPNTDHDAAWASAEKLRQQVGQLVVTFDEQEIRPTASFGLAVFSPGESGQPANIKALLHQADLALYQAKHQGRNRVVSATTAA